MTAKTTLKTHTLASVALLVSAIAPQIAFGQTMDTPDSWQPWQRTDLVGSWACQNTGSADVQRTLQSFSVGGVAFGTGQGDTIPPVLSPQIGDWRYLGKGRYSVSFESIIYDPSSGVPPGTFAGTAKIDEMIDLARSGKSLTGHFRFQMLDPDGNVIYQNEGAFKGRRITASRHTL